MGQWDIYKWRGAQLSQAMLSSELISSFLQIDDAQLFTSLWGPLSNLRGQYSIDMQ